MWNESEGKRKESLRELKNINNRFSCFPLEDSFVNDELSFQVDTTKNSSMENSEFNKLNDLCQIWNLPS